MTCVVLQNSTFLESRAVRTLGKSHPLKPGANSPRPCLRPHPGLPPCPHNPWSSLPFTKAHGVPAFFSPRKSHPRDLTQPLHLRAFLMGVDSSLEDRLQLPLECRRSSLLHQQDAGRCITPVNWPWLHIAVKTSLPASPV